MGQARSQGHVDGPLALGTWTAGAGSGVGFGMPRAGRAGGKACREQDCAMPAAGLRVPASNPAASPSSRRSKLKGRFMSSDPWGRGRLSAGIEAWHSSALLPLPLPHRAARPWRCPAPSCAPAPVPAAGKQGMGKAWQALVGLGGHLAVVPPVSPRPGGVTPSVLPGGDWPWRVGTRWALPGGGAAVPLPTPARTNPVAAAGESLHRPLCGKMVSGRSGERVVTWDPTALTLNSFQPGGARGEAGGQGSPPTLSRAPGTPELCHVHVPVFPHLLLFPGPFLAASPGEGLLSPWGQPWQPG